MSSGESNYDKVHIIAITGGSGSGKTTLAKRILEAIGPRKVAILGQDSYYLDQSKRFDGDGGEVNFDHPSALEFDLLEQHLVRLKSGEPIQVPVYDFVSHSRTKHIEHLDPHEIVLVDGTLLLSQKNLLSCFDYSIFLDVPENVRFERRLKRDVIERGRTEEGIRKQFFSQVKPMHDDFVQPSASNADIVLQMHYDIEDVMARIKDALTI